MSFRKDLVLRDAKEALRSAESILVTDEDTELTVAEIRAAAVQAGQAMAALYILLGVVSQEDEKVT